MEGTIQDYALVGMVTFSSYPGLITGEHTMAQVIQEIGADAFFDVVEITWIEDPKARAEAIQAADASSLSAAYAAQPYLLARKLNLSALEESQRRQAVSTCRQAIDQAVSWDAASFSVLSGPDPGPDSRTRATDQLVRSLVELSQYARSKGNISVALETFDRKPFGKNQLIGPTAEAVQLAQRVRSQVPNFGLLLDLSHLPLLEETSAAALETAKDYLQTVHVGNCLIKDPAHPAYGDNHPPFGTEGGEIGVPQLAEFLRELFRVGFLTAGRTRQPILSLEVRPLAGQHPAEIVQASKTALVDAFAQI